mgnify:FL=1
MTAAVLHCRHDLVEGRIARRYQRFLCDVELDGGRAVVAHCANTGTMATCWAPGDTVLLEPNDDLRRKLRYSLIAVRRNTTWVGVHTAIPNLVVAEAARRDLLPGLPGLTAVRTEVPYGAERSRIDLLAEDAGGRKVYVEVKNTTLRTVTADGPVVTFPDAVTARGTKHLRELRAVVEAGHRAAVVFFVHRGDAAAFDVANDIDPDYAEELDRAAAASVKVLPVQADLIVQRERDGWNASWSLAGLLPWVRARPR